LPARAEKFLSKFKIWIFVKKSSDFNQKAPQFLHPANEKRHMNISNLIIYFITGGLFTIIMVALEESGYRTL